MSRKYKDSKDVPTKILCDRLGELIKAITACDSGRSLSREFDMRIPVEVDRDADVILSEARKRLLDADKKEPVDLADEKRVPCLCPKYTGVCTDCNKDIECDHS